MKSCFRNFDVEIFGESHSSDIGVVITGMPEGIAVEKNALLLYMERRKAGKGCHSTERREPDEPVFTNGIFDGKTNGGVIRAVISNKDIKADPYKELEFIPRPSHADYVAYIKSDCVGFATGGGRFSGRMTAPLCVAGYIAKAFLEDRGIEVLAYISQIGKISADTYRDRDIKPCEIKAVNSLALPVISLESRAKIEQEIANIKKESDSLGGVVECIVFGLPAGIGESMFLGLEGRISASLFAVPAIKGVEFGAGFELASMTGSQANDPFVVVNTKIVTKTNKSGGINGGISNGMPVTLRVAVRPTTSIGKAQKSVNLKTLESVEICIKGRHDACIVPRAVPCVEAAVALAIMDAILDEESK